LNKVEFKPFTASAYVSETETTSAQANMYVNATSTGNCGTSYTLTATLTTSSGVVVNVPITAAEILAEAGQAVSVNIARDEDDFTFAV